MNELIHIETEVLAPIDEVWEKWNNPEDIIEWYSANKDWHCPDARNDLRVGGNFNYVLAAKDGSMSFDFGGVYDEIIPQKKIAFTLGDGRKVTIDFIKTNNGTKIQESFEAEKANPLKAQEMGWQAILDHFKDYVEKQKC